MISREEIPEHWEFKELSEVVEYQSSNINPQDYPKKEFNYVGLADMEKNTGKLKEFDKTQGEEIGSAKREFTANDILYGRLRPYLNKVASPDFSGICSTDIFVLRPKKSVSRQYVKRYLLTEGIRTKAENLMTGANHPRISKKNFMSFKIPIPPMEEQKVIVKKLDKIFKNIEAIQKAQGQAEKIYRDIAFSFFTSRVRDAETDTLETRELIESTQYGSSNATNSEGDGYPSLRMGNYNLRGEMDYSKIKFQDMEDEEFEKYQLEEGDVLFNRTNSKDLVGKMCIYDGGLDNAVFASYLIRVELNEDKVLPEYFVTYMNSHLGEIERQGKLKQAVSQANINATELREMEMAVPSLEKQEEIVESLDYMRSKVDEIETEVNRKRELIENIPNSVLAEAFKGNLVDFEEKSKSNHAVSTEQESGELNRTDYEVEGQHSLGEFK